MPYAVLFWYVASCPGRYKGFVVKLDLHTHCREATACPEPTVEIVARIVEAVKNRGLDGIAVTEHYTKRYAYMVKEIVDLHFSNEILVIPGQEIDRVYMGIDRGIVHIVELYLPGEITFRFVAHPGHPYSRDLGSRLDGEIHGIELKNPHHVREMDEQLIRQLASERDLIMLTNSDAHTLGEIGTYYNDLDLDTLYARAALIG